MPAKMYLMGRRVGKLTVVAEAPKNNSGKVRWLCRCDCGKEHIVIGTLLTTGRITSCGCEKNAKQRLYRMRRKIPTFRAGDIRRVRRICVSN